MVVHSTGMCSIHNTERLGFTCRDAVRLYATCVCSVFCKPTISSILSCRKLYVSLALSCSYSALWSPQSERSSEPNP